MNIDSCRNFFMNVHEFEDISWRLFYTWSVQPWTFSQISQDLGEWNLEGTNDKSNESDSSWNRQLL